MQQRRWAQGGVQAARKLLPRVLGSSLRPVVKLEGVVHLCGQFAYPLTFALALLVVPAAFARRELGMDALWWLDLALFAGAAGPFIAYYLTAARRRGRPWGRATWRAHRRAGPWRGTLRASHPVGFPRIPARPGPVRAYSEDR